MLLMMMMENMAVLGSALLAGAAHFAGDGDYHVHTYYENRLEEEEICSSTFCC